jgi:hypothetical protein
VTTFSQITIFEWTLSTTDHAALIHDSRSSVGGRVSVKFSITTGSFPPINWSWRQTPWDSQPEIFFNWTLAVIVLMKHLLWWQDGFVSYEYVWPFESKNIFQSRIQRTVCQSHSDGLVYKNPSQRNVCLSQSNELFSRIYLHGNVFTESLLSNGHMRHNIKPISILYLQRVASVLKNSQFPVKTPTISLPRTFAENNPTVQLMHALNHGPPYCTPRCFIDNVSWFSCIFPSSIPSKKKKKRSLILIILIEVSVLWK